MASDDPAWCSTTASSSTAKVSAPASAKARSGPLLMLGMTTAFIAAVMLLVVALITTSEATAIPSGASTANDSLLSNYFCQKYYHGEGDCAGLRSRALANHSRTVPTLELGDPSKPAMVFLHGWPDSAALWANQFEYFCDGAAAKFFCVAPSWFDYHPDVPARPAEDLFWDRQVDAFHRTIAIDMGLRDITFVIFDFGCVVGYQLLYRFPSLVKRVVSMDIGMSVLGPEGLPPGTPKLSDLMAYQQTNVKAFLTHNDSLMQSNIHGTPCAGCAVITANTGWPYNQFVRDKQGETWPERLGVPRSQWKFSLAPDFPQGTPLLFTFGTCDISTGCPGCAPCKPRSFYFFGQDWINWIRARGAGDQNRTRAVPIDGAGHWTNCWASRATNEAIGAWLAELGS